MEKLDKVIAGLEFCGEANKSVDACLMMCPYYGERDGDKVCMDFLMEDALAVILDLQEKLKMAKDGRLELGRQIQGWMEYFGGLQYYNDRWYDGFGNVVEVEPVVHAHWEQYTDEDENWGDLPYFRCSACGTVELTGRKRCPECGAHMDENLEIRTCYCPICDKHFEVRSNDSMGSCPDCGHHVVLHIEGETNV